MIIQAFLRRLGEFHDHSGLFSAESIEDLKKTTGWWLSPTPLKNDGVRQLG